MNITTKYETYIHDKWSLVKDEYNQSKDNRLIAKIFEWYTCIKLSEKKKDKFYEYSDIDPDFKEENKLTQNDTGIDCCNLKDTIVQCKLRSKSLTWTDCATFFASQVIYDDIKNQTIIRWKNLIIARNSNLKLSDNLKFKKDLFVDKSYDLNELVNFCNNLLENKPILPEEKEEKIKLRDYQIECINKIKETDKNIVINLPTGCGKNVIIISSLEKNKKYLILVSRIILMEQINESIKKINKKLSSDIQCIGDNNNEYDDKKLITICVYNSIDKIINKDKFDKIFIDESHHIIKPQIYCNDDDSIKTEDEEENTYINKISNLSQYNNNVYLSATIDKTDNFEYYSKDIREMINLKYLSDYTINIPIFDDDITNTNICWHLIKNYSNIIVYCSNQEEGKLFDKTLNKLIPGCSNYIDCNTTKSKRDKIINKYKEGKLTFLVNVKILVEGFDAPITKGVCFIHLPSSKTTLVQIIGRALRLHQLKTVAKIILPCSTNDDSKNINNFLKIMAKNDSRIKKSFENKLLGGYINLEYVNNENNNAESSEITEARYEMIYDSMGKLKNFQEIWDYKLEVLFDFVSKNNRVPKNKEEHKNIKINDWFLDQKKKINSKEDELYKKLSANNTVKTNLDEYLEKKKENKKINTFDESLKIFVDYVEKNNKIPTKKEYEGQWFQDRKKKINSNKDELYKKLSVNNLVKINLDECLEKKDLNKDKEKLSFDETFQLLTEFINKHKRVPIKTEQHKNVNIGRWLGTQKAKIYSTEHEIYKKLSVNKIIKEDLDKNLNTKEQNKDKEKLTFDDNLNMLLEFINKNNRIPIKKEKYKDVNIFSWLWNQKIKINSTNDDTYKQLSKNKILKSNLDDYLKNKTEVK